MSAARGAPAGRAAASGGAAPGRGWRPLGHGARDGGGPASSHGRSARSVGRPMSLRLRINLVITLVTVAFTLAMAYEMVNDLRSSVREEIESTTRVAVQLVETVVAGAYLDPGPTQRIDALLALLRRVHGAGGQGARRCAASGRGQDRPLPRRFRRAALRRAWSIRSPRAPSCASRSPSRMPSRG